MPKTIFVSGATGTTGGATVRALLARGARVVAGVHSPAKGSALEALGVTVRPFDLANVSAMADAMRGAAGIYLVTPVSEHTEQMTRAMVDAAKAAGVGHIVKLSGLDADELQGLAQARWHFDAEQAIRASGLRWTFLRANSFFQNFHGAIETIKTLGVYYNTYRSAEVSLVDARDIGEVAAAVLMSDGHAEKIYNLTGPRGVANDEVVNVFSAAAGKPVKSIDVGGAQLAQALVGFGMPPAVAIATADLLDHMATGVAAYVSPDIEALLGRAPRDFTQWTRDNAQAFR